MVDGTCRWRRYAAACAALALSVAAQQPDSSTRRASGQPSKVILAIADVSTDSYQHDSISHALSTVEGLGGSVYDTVIRTDLQLVTKGAIAAATGTLTFYKNLDDFDAVIWMASGDPPLTTQQKEDLLSFVRAGKGLVVLHSGLSSARTWPGFADMIGASVGEEPKRPEEFRVSILDAAFMAQFPKSFRIAEAFRPVQVRAAASPSVNLRAHRIASKYMWYTSGLSQVLASWAKEP
jgi:trehalose utilization protein